MKKILLSCTMICLFAGCVDDIKEREGATLKEFHKERSKSLELVDLIDSLVQGYGLSEWDVLAGTKQVDWDHKGLNGDDVYYHSNYARTGKLHVLLNDEFPNYMLDERKEPVMWSILLSGSRGGYSNIVLSNGVYSHDFVSAHDYFKEQGVLSKVDTVECPDSDPWCSNIKYHLEVNGKKILVREYVAGGGTAGVNVKLFFNSTGEDFELP